MTSAVVHLTLLAPKGGEGRKLLSSDRLHAWPRAQMMRGARAQCSGSGGRGSCWCSAGRAAKQRLLLLLLLLLLLPLLLLLLLLCLGLLHLLLIALLGILCSAPVIPALCCAPPLLLLGPVELPHATRCSL